MSGGPGVPVLMYHWVHEDPGTALSLYGVTPSAFRAQVRWLRRLRRRSLTLAALHDHMTGKARAPRGGVVLTFDDGYVDNAENALPVLEEARMTATVFVVTDRAGQTNVWDAAHGDPPRPLLSWDRMRALDGKTLRFEPHSRTHPQLPTLAPERAREEIEGAKKRLEDELGRASLAFAYPHGAYDDRVEALVREAGYAMALTVSQGLNRPGDDPLRVRRTGVTSRDIAPTFLFKIATGYGVMGMIRS